MSRERSVLIVTTAFPPTAAVGAHRIVKFCKFLPEFGWRPVVLTLRYPPPPHDERLLRGIDAEQVAVRRAGSLRRFRPAAGPAAGPAPQVPQAPTVPSSTGGLRQALGKLIRFPDRHNSWIPFALHEALQVAGEEQVRVVLSSSPPVSSHLVATALSAVTNIPLVTDFRDLWTRNEHYSALGRPAWLAAVERGIESRVLRRSRAVITTSESFTRTVREQCPPDEGRIFATITNGIDRDDLEGVSFPERRSKKFTIFHPGSFYGQRDPAFFFRAMDRWLAGDPGRRDAVELLLVGDTELVVPEQLTDNVRSVLRVEGHWPHGRVLEQLWRSDLLLLVLGFDDAVSGVIPAKLFEFIACRRPILALVPRGEAAALIAETGAGEAVTGPDEDEVVRQLDRAFQAWSRSGDPPASEIFVPPGLDRRLLTGRLAEILDAVAPGKRGSA